MKESEQSGFRGLISHSALIKGGEVTLNIENEFKKNGKVALPKKFEITIQTN